MWAQDRDFTDWKRDPAKVKAKLAEGGMPNGFAFTVEGLGTSPPRFRSSRSFQAELKEVASTWKIELLEFGKLLADLNSHNFAALRIGWSGRPDPDVAMPTSSCTARAGSTGCATAIPRWTSCSTRPGARAIKAKRKALYAQVTRSLPRTLRTSGSTTTPSEGVERARQRVRAHLGRHDAVQRVWLDKR